MNKKGFAALFIILIVAALALGSGIVYYAIKKSSPAIIPGAATPAPSGNVPSFAGTPPVTTSSPTSTQAQNPIAASSSTTAATDTVSLDAIAEGSTFNASLLGTVTDSLFIARGRQIYFLDLDHLIKYPILDTKNEKYISIGNMTLDKNNRPAYHRNIFFQVAIVVTVIYFSIYYVVVYQLSPTTSNNIYVSNSLSLAAGMVNLDHLC